MIQNQARRVFGSFVLSPLVLAVFCSPTTVLADALGDALDSPALTWTTGGDANWQSQGSVTHDGVDAAQNGDIDDDEESWVQTTVTGPGTLTFWWKVSSEGGFDYLTLYVDGDPEEDRISGEVDWEQVSLPLTAGTHTLRWLYNKDGSADEGEDSGYLDEVVFTPDGPVNTGTATNLTETTATLNGSVDPTGLVTTATFEYGLTTAYGSTASVTLSPNNGNGHQQLNTSISGLLPATLYHFRMVATNSANPAPGADRTFSTVSPFLYTASGGAVTITGYQGTSLAVVIPSTIIGLPVTRIDDDAFYYQDDLTSITIPSSVTSIGSSAFYGCTGLTSMVIPTGVTSIESSAFGECGNLTSISLPTTVTSIGSYAFGDCYKLTGMVIPAGITSIGSSLFSNCYNLTSVTLPASVTSIGSGAFSGCESLTGLSLPPAVTSIGSSAFSDCSSLASLTIPAGVTSVQDETFNDCSSLTGIILPNGVTSIGESAFSDCTSLASVAIPTSVSYIDFGAFSGCRSLLGVTIPNGVSSISSSTFSGCTSLLGVTVPNTVTSIGSSAFRNCEALTGLGIPAGVTSIGSSAFSGCAKLTAITIPAAVTFLADYLFSDCSSLVSVNIPGGVTSIGDEVFTNCSSLASITIPAGVTTIGESAFSGCSSLTTVAVPANVTFIGDSAFSACSSLLAISVNALNLNYSSNGGVLFNKATTTLIQAPGGIVGSYAIPGTVSAINSYAFSYCANLTAVAIPNGVVSIGTGSFEGCSGLTNVVIPNSVTTIGGSAFFGCGKLTSVTLSSNLTNIRYETFAHCSKLASVAIPASVTNIDDGAFSYCGSLASITLPANLTGIGEEAFTSCSSLTGIAIPRFVGYIGDDAFARCSSLLAITVNALNNNFSSLGGVLFDKNRTYLIKFPEAIAGAYVIPNTVTEIGYSAFRYSRNLTGVTIPTSVNSIGSSAFRYCRSLTAVTVPSSVTEIPSFAFSYCTSLTSVTLPASIEGIGSYAFAGCIGLTGITIPANVSYIESYAFSGASNLTKALFAGHSPSLGDDVFYPVSTGFKIYFLNSKFGFTSPTWNGYASAGYDSLTTPEIVVEQTGGANLVDGTTSVSFGTAVVGSSVSKTFTIKNTGVANLTGILITKNGTNAADFTITTSPATSVSGPTGGTSFTVKFLPSAAGAKSAAIHIANNDTNESPFDIPLTATATAPEISVKVTTELVDGKSSLNFGSAVVKATVVKSFIIKNLGNAPLTGLAVSKSGAQATDYTVAALATTTLAPGFSTTFKVTFKPSAKGVRAAAIKIASNDANESPFDISLTGTGTVKKAAPRTSAMLALSQASHDTLTTSAHPAHRGIQVIDGRKYLTVTLAKTESAGCIVEVSPDLVHWFSGSNHVTVVTDNARILKVRDNTPVLPGAKRHIRINPISH